MTTVKFKCMLLVILLLTPTACLTKERELHYAAFNGWEAGVTRWLKAGADVNAKDDRYGATPLHLAAYEGHADVVTMLLEHGADVDARNADGQTPRDLATNEAVIRLLEHATGKETP